MMTEEEKQRIISSLGEESDFRDAMGVAVRRLLDVVDNFVVIVAMPTDEAGNMLAVAWRSGDIPDAIRKRLNLTGREETVIA